MGEQTANPLGSVLGRYLLASGADDLDGNSVQELHEFGNYPRIMFNGGIGLVGVKSEEMSKLQSQFVYGQLGSDGTIMIK